MVNKKPLIIFISLLLLFFFFFPKGSERPMIGIFDEPFVTDTECINESLTLDLVDLNMTNITRFCYGWLIPKQYPVLERNFAVDVVMDRCIWSEEDLYSIDAREGSGLERFAMDNPKEGRSTYYHYNASCLMEKNYCIEKKVTYMKCVGVIDS
jgi:hypothetical protein